MNRIGTIIEAVEAARESAQAKAAARGSTAPMVGWVDVTFQHDGTTVLIQVTDYLSHATRAAFSADVPVESILAYIDTLA